MDSCTISSADLVGGWLNYIKINKFGVGTWETNGRPPFTVKPTDTCGSFDFTFPDDGVYRGELSADKNLITYSPDNRWPKTSSAEPACSLKFVNKPAGNNYAACDGIYVIDTSKRLNGQPVYINAAKSRFLGYTGSNWVVTGTQWLDGILQSQGGFGGFHGNQGTNVLAGWSSYDVFTDCPLTPP